MQLQFSTEEKGLLEKMQAACLEDQFDEAMCEERVRSHARAILKREYEMEEMLDHAWNLFINLEDFLNDDLVKSVIYFIDVHGFDATALPPRLFDHVERVRKKNIRDMMEEEDLRWKAIAPAFEMLEDL